MGQADPDIQADDLFDPLPSEYGLIALAKLPLFADILRTSALMLRDENMSLQFETEWQKFLLSQAIREISGLQGGLLKVHMYMREDGSPFIPGGELLKIAGVGPSPVDVLARSFRVKSMHTQIPGAMSNESYYVWLKRANNGQLRAGILPREFRAKLENDGIREGRRLYDYYSTLEHAGNLDKIIALGTAVSDTVNRARRQAADAQRSKQLGAIESTHSEAIRQLATLVNQYNSLIDESRRQDRTLRLLGEIQTVLGLIGGALKIKQLFSNDGAPAHALDSDETQMALHLRLKRETMNQSGYKRQEIEFKVRDVNELRNALGLFLDMADRSKTNLSDLEVGHEEDGGIRIYAK